jgi:guanylate kinase
MAGTLFIISAPSGAGKTTLVAALLKKQPSLVRVVTYTSRSPRKGEVEGSDYYFIPESEFKAKIVQGFFLEWSLAYGAYYGSARSLVEVLDVGVSCIAVVDRTGAQALQALIGSAVLIWIRPPSLKILEDRLRLRGTEAEERILSRLQLAEQELEQEQAHPLFHYTIINDNFDKALGSLVALISQKLSA